METVRQKIEALRREKEDKELLAEELEQKLKDERAEHQLVK